MFFVIDQETHGSFDNLKDATEHAARRGGLVVELISPKSIEKPEPDENVWSEADKLAYEREVERSEKAWAATNNLD